MTIPATDRWVEKTDNQPKKKGAVQITPEGVRIVSEALKVWALRCDTDPGLIKAKRGTPRHLIIRKGLVMSVKGLLPTTELAAILGMNRSTIEDDQAAAENWMEADDAIDASLANMSECVARFIAVNPQVLEDAMTQQYRYDQSIKKMEEIARAEERERRRAEETRRDAARRRRFASIEQMEETLRSQGITNWKAMGAQQRGAEHTADSLSPRAKADLTKLMRADGLSKFDDRRLPEDKIVALTELLELGLAKRLPLQKSDENVPRVAITAFGMSAHGFLRNPANR